MIDNDLVLHAIIDPVAKTLTAELVNAGQAWLSLGFSPGMTTMAGSQTVLAWPEDPVSLTNPAKYDMNAESAAGVVLMEDSRQTLTNATIVQNSTHTILRFTKLLEESNENPISATSNASLVWALGASNTIKAHIQRGGFSMKLNQCIADASLLPPSTPSNSAAPAAAPSTPATVKPTQSEAAPSSTAGNETSGSSTTVDCSSFRDNPIKLIDDDLVLHAIIDPVAKTLSAELVYVGQAWLSVGFSPGKKTMIGSQAVTGWPDQDLSLTNPGKYDMTTETEAGVILMDDSRQTLTNATIFQNDTHTVLKFTKILEEPNENSISASGEASLVWAVGMDNSMPFHIKASGFSLKLNQCVVDATLLPPPTPTPSNSAGPPPPAPSSIETATPTKSKSASSVPVSTVSSSNSTTVDCSSFRDNPIPLGSTDLIMHAILNPMDRTLTAELVYQGQAWLSLGFAPGRTTMTGSQAVIGWPEEDASSPTNPAKYDMNAESEAGVVRMDDSRQTLMNATIVQNDTHTVLTFTKFIEESNENSVSATDASWFVWAVGASNTIKAHGKRGGLSLVVNQCVVSKGGVVMNAGSQQDGVVSVSNDNRKLWMAHGVTAATAWGILVPLAVGSALIRKLLEAMGLGEEVWFQLHRGLNMLAALLTVISFSIAVYIFNKEPGEVHFSEDLHHTLGLVIFILTLLQALNGVCRPHLPQVKKSVRKSSDYDYDDAQDSVEEPRVDNVLKKSTTRIVWEFGHRILGVALLAMSWWQVQDGIGLFIDRFPDDTDPTPVFWGVVIGISGIIVILVIIQIIVMRKIMR